MDTQYPVSIAAVTTALETIDSFVQHLTRNSDTEANDLSTLRNTFNAFSANLEEACARQLNQSLLHKRSQAPKTKLQDDIHGFNTDVDTLALAVLPKVRPQPARRHVKWTEEDENKLCDMHENGTSFKALEKVFPERTGAALRRKYYDLRPKDQEEHYKKRKLSQEKDIVPGSYSRDMDEFTTMIVDDEASDHSEEHCKQPLPLLPLEQKGTVPCPNYALGCTRVFATYALANTHDLNMCDFRQKDGPLPCPWDCGMTFPNRRGLTSHYQVHNHILEGNKYTCRRCGNTSWPDAYLLTCHEEKCDVKDNAVRSGQSSKLLRIKLGTDTAKSSIIIVARVSGSSIPKAWYAGKSSLEEGLPIWVQPTLEAYRRLYQDYRPAEIHVGAQVQTAFTPTPSSIHNLADTAGSTIKNSNFYQTRAFNFTTQIVSALRGAPIDSRPVILSVGVDGFTCNTSRMEAFLQRVCPLKFVVKLHTISYQQGQGPSLTPDLLWEDGNSWWADYTSEHLIRVFQQATAVPGLQAANELKIWWEDLQRRKDTMSANILMTGRNS